MPLDIAALKRRYKPERHLAQRSHRPESELVSAAAAVGTKQVLIDTTVYIHEVAGRLPHDAEALLDAALRFHSSLAVAEIVSGLSNLHPNSANFERAWAYYQRLFSSIPRNRLLAPDLEILAQAGVISGILARTQNYGRSQLKDLFNDAAIYLTAARLGISLLTANRDDHDLIQQVAGHGAFIYYAAV